MSYRDYDITAAGHLHIQHNGLTAHTGRKLLLDSAAPATVLMLAKGFITATSVATNYEGDPALLSTYHVRTGRSVAHNGTTLAAGAAITLDPVEDHTADLIARGFVS